MTCLVFFFFFQAEDGIRDLTVTGVQTCALPILRRGRPRCLGRRAQLREHVRARVRRAAFGGQPCALIAGARVAFAMSSPALPMRQRPMQEREQLDLFRALRSEEHTSELQSQSNLVCRLLL